MKYYLAYGSNLSVEQMKSRCPDAVPVTVAFLNNYRLTFAGRDRSAVATIIPEDGCVVPVAIWKISERDERALDVYEGYPRFYIKENVKVMFGGKLHEVMAYIMTERRAESKGVPSEYYLDVIRGGYEDFDLDAYVLDEAVEHARNERLKQLSAMQDAGDYTVCPRCGVRMDDPHRHALSRRADIMICDLCGQFEAIFDYMGENDPVTNWYCFR